MDRVMQDLLADTERASLVTTAPIPDCLPKYAAWERTLEVDRAVREGVRWWAYGVAINREAWPALLALLLSKGKRSRLFACILQAWREQHQ